MADTDEPDTDTQAGAGGDALNPTVLIVNGDGGGL